MARLPYFDQSDLKPEHKDLLDRPINLFGALVHSPDFAHTWNVVGGHIRHKSKLDPRRRELAILQDKAVLCAAREMMRYPSDR